MANPVCPLCVTPPFSTVAKILRHIRVTHADADSFNIQCTLQGCCRTFRSFLTYRTHIYRHHRHSLTQGPCQGEPTMEEEEDESITDLSLLDSEDGCLHAAADLDSQCDERPVIVIKHVFNTTVLLFRYCCFAKGSSYLDS